MGKVIVDYENLKRETDFAMFAGLNGYADVTVAVLGPAKIADILLCFYRLRKELVNTLHTDYELTEDVANQLLKIADEMVDSEDEVIAFQKLMEDWSERP